MTRPLEDVQDEILEQLHSGERVDRARVLEEHPEHRSALEGFFELVELVEAPGAPAEPMPVRLGEFRIVREIGRGGMGVVYEAEQPSLRRRVALKVLPPVLRGDPARLQRFKREAEAAARLRHPNIVPVFSFGEGAGTPFFAMELVDGHSLADIVSERRAGDSPHWREVGEASWRRAVETVARVAEALAYAHDHGILHRDVKPGNVIIERNGTPRLTDFGLALDLEAQSLTVSGEVFGSPRYMSPEQAFRRESPLDARTDVYSLAVTLFELLTLELPYRGTTQTDVLSALSSGETVPLRQLDGSLPSALENVLVRGLAHDPNERYGSAADFARDLRAVLAGGVTRFGTRPSVVSSAAAAQEAQAAPRRREMSWAAQVLMVLGCLGFVALFGLVAVGLFVGAAAPGPMRSTPAALQTEILDHLPAPMIQAIARGEFEGGSQALITWAEPELRVRSVVARNAPAVLRMGVSFALPPEGLVAPVTVVPIWEMRVDGGDWEYLGLDVQQFDLAGTGSVRRWYSHDLRVALGDRLQARSAKLAFRLRLRVLEPVSHWAGRNTLSHGEAEQPHVPTLGDPESLGTMASFVFPERAVFFYDEYPDDYPRPVDDEHSDARMRFSVTPRLVSYEGLTDRSILLGLHWEPDQLDRPLPAAFQVDLHESLEGPPIGFGTLALERFVAPPGDTQVRTMSVVSFQLADEPSEAEKRFLLALQNGSLETVTLMFRPSRDVALEQPGFEKFWDDGIVATLPYQPESQFEEGTR